ncbi:MAG: tRNA (cytidine(34)-2'-O)-methyltransferase [Elusimicrobia bacterium]|nr:tRNA (cytidine(34)-2'-O)-methyltransferase [Elusimicrobiota bacterium]
MRGYYGIGIYHPKTTSNIGTLWRTAHAFNANHIFTIGRRYNRQASDTSGATGHIPLFEYESLAEFDRHIPKGCSVICIEKNSISRPLHNFVHPERAIYLLGAEDYGLPEEYMEHKTVVEIPGGQFCLNVAVAGSIVIYDRITKEYK